MGTWEILIPTQAFLPLGIAVLRWLNLSNSSPLPMSLDHSEKPVRQNTISLMSIITLSSFVVLSQPFVTFPSTALGLAYILLSTLAYTTLDDTLGNVHDRKQARNGSFVSANGSISRRESSASRTERNSLKQSLRDLSAAMVVGCAIATLLFENLSTNRLIYRRKLDGLAAENWKKDHWLLYVGQGLAIGLIGSLQCVLSFSMVSAAIKVSFCMWESRCIVSSKQVFLVAPALCSYAVDPLHCSIAYRIL